jgi:hypothetical protein
MTGSYIKTGRGYWKYLLPVVLKKMAPGIFTGGHPDRRTQSF